MPLDLAFWTSPSPRCASSSSLAPGSLRVITGLSQPIHRMTHQTGNCSNERTSREEMHMNSMKVMGRAVTALALGAAITMSTAALAGADGSGHWGRDVASARVSPFDYANNGTGGDVTAVTSTSVTIQL